MDWSYSTLIGGSVPGLSYTRIGGTILGLGVRYPNWRYSTWIGGTTPGLGVWYPNGLVQYQDWWHSASVGGIVPGLGVCYPNRAYGTRIGTQYAEQYMDWGYNTSIRGTVSGVRYLNGTIAVQLRSPGSFEVLGTRCSPQDPLRFHCCPWDQLWSLCCSSNPSQSHCCPWHPLNSPRLIAVPL